MPGPRDKEKDSSSTDTQSTELKKVEKTPTKVEKTSTNIEGGTGSTSSVLDAIIKSGAGGSQSPSTTPTSIPPSPSAGSASLPATPVFRATSLSGPSPTPTAPSPTAPSPSPTAPSPTPTAPITTPGGSRATTANTKEVFAKNIATMQKLGYQQLTHTPLPAIAPLKKLLENATGLKKILENPTEAEGTLAKLVTHLQQQAIAQKAPDPETFVKTKLQNIIDATNKITALIKDNKLTPLDEFKVFTSVNSMSQRLFLNPKDEKLYLAPQRQLSNGLLTQENAQKLLKESNFAQGIFAVLLTKTADNKNYALEHRIYTRAVSGSGHDDLIDDQKSSFLLGGEVFHTQGHASMIANKTSYHDRMTKVLGITPDDQEAIMNLCVNGLLGRSYAMELTSGLVDIDKYAEAARNAIADSKNREPADPLLRRLKFG